MEEIWIDIEGYEGLYMISSEGNVKSLLRSGRENYRPRITKEKILKQSIDFYGYPRVTLSKGKVNTTYKVHRIVAMTFIPNPENKPQVNHINGIKHDSRVVNLEYVTNKENYIHARKHNLLKFAVGEKSSKSKLKTNQVIELRALFKSKQATRKQLAEKYKVTTQSIDAIISGKNWKHLL